MTHHMFGAIVGDEEIGAGVLQMENAILLDNYSTLAIALRQEPHLPAVAFALSGRVKGTDQDTFSGTFVCSWMDAGALVKQIVEHAEREGGDAFMDFRAGLVDDPQQSGEADG